MRIETRFAWIIAFCFFFGLSIAGYISFKLEARQAREEVKLKADMLLETALAVRSYTVDEVAPALLNKSGDSSNNSSHEFHPAQVPSFAAQNAMQRLATKFPDYRYRESSLNPTRLSDRASDWEVGLLRQFEADVQQKELVGETGSGKNQRFYVARPIRMSSAACLQCHSVPAAAPAAMLAKYGPLNGFGWKMGEVVGLQLVEVPTAPARDKAFNSVLVTVGSLSAVFVLTAAIFLMLLRRHVTHPLAALTKVAHAASLEDRATGAAESAQIPGEFGDLHQAILRLRASVDRALRLFERERPRAEPKASSASGNEAD